MSSITLVKRMNQASSTSSQALSQPGAIRPQSLLLPPALPHPACCSMIIPAMRTNTLPSSVSISGRVVFWVWGSCPGATSENDGRAARWRSVRRDLGVCESVQAQHTWCESGHADCRRTRGIFDSPGSCRLSSINPHHGFPAFFSLPSPLKVGLGVEVCAITSPTSMCGRPLASAV